MNFMLHSKKEEHSSMVYPSPKNYGPSLMRCTSTTSDVVMIHLLIQCKWRKTTAANFNLQWYALVDIP